jgi:hypothetical protein
MKGFENDFNLLISEFNLKHGLSIQSFDLQYSDSLDFNFEFQSIFNSFTHQRKIVANQEECEEFQKTLANRVNQFFNRINFLQIHALIAAYTDEFGRPRIDLFKRFDPLLNRYVKRTPTEFLRFFTNAFIASFFKVFTKLIEVPILSFRWLI